MALVAIERARTRTRVSRRLFFSFRNTRSIVSQIGATGNTYMRVSQNDLRRSAMGAARWGDFVDACVLAGV